MIEASNAATKSAIWLAVCAVLSIFGGRGARRTAAITVGATLTAQVIANVGLKPLFRRKRPFRKSKLRSALLVRPPREHSWPSGHTASSAAAATVLCVRHPRYAMPIAVLAILIGYSRVYVGVHYPFDVLAGGAIGTAVGGAWISALHPSKQS